jgi:hypothetical protein
MALVFPIPSDIERVEGAALSASVAGGTSGRVVEKFSLLGGALGAPYHDV